MNCSYFIIHCSYVATGATQSVVFVTAEKKLHILLLDVCIHGVDYLFSLFELNIN